MADAVNKWGSDFTIRIADRKIAGFSIRSGYYELVLDRRLARLILL